MTDVASRSAARHKRHERIRLRLAGTAERPRLAVFRSLNHIYAQVIDDTSGRTLAAASTREPELKGSKQTKTEEAAVVGRLVAERKTPHFFIFNFFLEKYNFYLLVFLIKKTVTVFTKDISLYLLLSYRLERSST